MEIDEQQSEQSRQDRIKDLCNNSGISAIGRAANAKSRLKGGFWLSLLTLALIGFSQNIYENIQRYKSYPILTQMEQEYNVFLWPHVTICNPSSPIAFWAKPDLIKTWDKLGEKVKKLSQMKYEGGKAVHMQDHYYRMSSVDPTLFFKGSPLSSILSLQVI